MSVKLAALPQRQIDLSEWVFGLDDYGCPDPVVGKAVKEAIENTMVSGGGAWAEFPICWDATDGYDGPPITDPLAITISFPLGPEDRDPVWRFGIGDLVDDFIVWHTADHGVGGLDVKDRPRFESLSKAFSDLAEKLNEVLNRPAATGERDTVTKVSNDHRDD